MGYIMDGLEAEACDRSYADRSVRARLMGYFKPVGRLMVLVAIMILLNSVADTVLPVLVSRGIDSLRTARSLQTLGLLVAAILVSGVLSWTFNFVRHRHTALAVGDIAHGLRHA